MDTPIFEFVSKTKQDNFLRLFMPGHKGKAPFAAHPLEELFPYDITEITGADALFEAAGIIGESEENATALFDSKFTVYSTGGSTLCIQTMLALVAQRGKKIIAGRNAHMAFVHSCILLQVEPIWLLPETSDAYGVCGLITAEQVEHTLQVHPDAAAVYVTSPDYLGNTVDVAAIAEVCHAWGTLLLCDNAHGAYLKFGEKSRHPLDQGADICCDSAHKTLPVLTGGAYLHVGKWGQWTCKQVKQTMNLFGSTSPSYLTLLSLDLCNRYLAEQGQSDFCELQKRVAELKKRLTARGIGFLKNETDFAKLTIDALSIGLKGTDLQGKLAEAKMECEYKNEQYVVLLLSPFFTEEEWQKLIMFCEQLPICSQVESELCEYELPPRKLWPYEAYWTPSVSVPLDQAVGRICSQTVTVCPPGVPIILPGEVITDKIKKICKSSGNLILKVIE